VPVLAPQPEPQEADRHRFLAAAGAVEDDGLRFCCYATPQPPVRNIVHSSRHSSRLSHLMTSSMCLTQQYTCSQARMTMARTIKLYKLSEETATPGIRPMQQADVPQVLLTPALRCQLSKAQQGQD
jgi:Myristoyl-CoA:protein N-myristoyltransferase, C-terminal domain